MEIRKVNNEIINEYPRITEFNKKKLKKYVPKKWTKIGISSFVFGILMKNTKSNAAVALDGGYPIFRKVDPVYNLLDKGSKIFGILSIILSIVSIILTVIQKYKNKKEKLTKLTNKRMKILYIITGISIIVSVILKIAYEIY